MRMLTSPQSHRCQGSFSCLVQLARVIGDEMDQLSEHIIEVINDRKEEICISIVELSRRTGIKEIPLGNALRGERKLSAAELVRICWYMDINMSGLYLPEMKEAFKRETGAPIHKPKDGITL